MATSPTEDIFAPILRTERLTLTLFNMNDPDDNEFVVKMFNAEVAGAGPTDGNWTVADVRRLSYSVMLKPSDVGGRASKGPAVYIGHIGDSTNSPFGVFNLCRRSPNVPVDLGFMILPEHRRKGYGTEAAARILQYATEELGVKEISLITSETNIPARKLAERINMIDGGWVSSDGHKSIAYILPGMQRLEGEHTTFWGDGKEPETST
ncbi:hypothetical protein TARUN_5744 [Trichoderma arundinaceum]|uniref:N-acetyltransferase domain-containing protein n=1 Tax=Trichoderma arundinaceum TaxID=490622 RepID=A0A395NKZ5_TRIAR|nr:hypothetical protein TARUN_5744 [Trichoderma arundinaceum]